MSGREGIAASPERIEAERRLVASVIEGGPGGVVQLLRTPLCLDSLTIRHRYALRAAVELAGRNEAVRVDSAAEVIRREAGEAVADEVRDAIEDALDDYREAGAPGVVGKLASTILDLADAEQDGAKPAGATRLLSVSDIFAPLPPVNWLLEALDVAPGAPLLVAGYGFSGKTISLQDLALAVATGTPAWGTFPVRAGRVLHMDYEQGSYLTRMRYQRLASARGVAPEDLEDRLSLAALPDWYLDGDPSDRLERLCDGYDLVIVDSFRAACPRTDENSSDARVPLDRLTRCSEKSGAVFGVIHHARKPVRDAQGGARMSVRGSGALYDALGSLLVFAAEKGEPIAVSHEKARITGRTHEDFRLLVEDVQIDGDPMGGLRVVYVEAPASQAKQSPSDRFTDLKGRVLALVREEGTVAGGVNALRARLGGRKDDISAAVAELDRAGAIRRGGTYREPTLTYAGTDGDCE